MKNKQIIKILMISSTFPLNDSDYHGIMVKNFVKYFDMTKVKITFLVPHHYQTSFLENNKNYSVIRFPYFFPFKFQKLAYHGGMVQNFKKSFFAKIQLAFYFISLFLYSLFLVKKYDLIHIQWIENSLPIVPIIKLFKKPLIITVRRSNIKNYFIKLIFKYIIKNSSHLVFNSTYTFKQFEPLITNISKVSIIPTSIDIKKFEIKQERYLYKKLNINSNIPIIGTISMLVEKKGIAYLIQAFYKIQKEKDAILVIGGEGPEYQNLKNLILSLNLTEKVFLIGKVLYTDIPKVLKDFSIFILPSIVDSSGETETLGVVLLEALASQLPVIASNVGGIGDIIDNNCGILVPPKNTDILAKNIKFLLENPEQRKQLAFNGKSKIETSFSHCYIGEKYYNIYKKIGKFE